MQVGSDPASPEADAGAKLAEKWASVPSTHHPPLGGSYTLKISRHRDGSGAEWAWVGLYQSVAPSKAERGGFYFGAGVAIPELVPADVIIHAVDELFKQSRKRLFSDEKMVKSIFKVGLGDFRLPELAGCAQPMEASGLNPSSERGRFVQIPDLDEDTLGEEIKLALFSNRYCLYSTLYLGNWSDPRISIDFYVPADASPEPRPRVEDRFVPAPVPLELVEDVPNEEEWEEQHAAQESEAVSHSAIPHSQHNIEQLYSKIDEVLRRISNIDRQLLRSLDELHHLNSEDEGPARGERMRTIDYVLIGFLFLTLLAVLSLMVQIGDGFRFSQ